MRLRDKLEKEYLDWIFNLVYGKRYSKSISYDKLLHHLHHVEFSYSIPKDGNRYKDGLDLRYRFVVNKDYEDETTAYLDGPCSILEMMVALALRCEEDIMDDPNVGDRTGQWFWGMIVSLGLGSMTDDRFNEEYVVEIVDDFLDRKYAQNGQGGLFTIKNCPYDLRSVEIWNQLSCYLNTIT